MKKMVFHGLVIVFLLLGTILVAARAEKKIQDKQEAVSQDESVGDPAWGPFVGGDPFLEMERFQRRMEYLMQTHFGSHLHHPPVLGEKVFLEPSVDLEETDQEVVLRCDLPGIEKDKIELTLKDDVVVLKGTQQTVREEKKNASESRYYRSERRVGSFYRAIPLPVPVDAQHAKANYENGVLTIHLPKIIQKEEKGIPIQIV